MRFDDVCLTDSQRVGALGMCTVFIGSLDIVHVAVVDDLIGHPTDEMRHLLGDLVWASAEDEDVVVHEVGLIPRSALYPLRLDRMGKMCRNR